MSFARTKIRPPRPRAGVVLPRPRLERALAAALASDRAVLLCAAAGYGKTALLARAIEQLPSEHAVAWVSLDEGDDLHRLLTCLLAALEPFDPPWRTAPEGLIAAATRAGADVGAAADELINTLDACEVPHGVVVLDDLHHVGDADSLRFVDRLLQRLSPRWTLALAARHEPPLRLARLRAAGELSDFREAQLRFAAEESRQLLAAAGLDAEAADALHARTAGWAAGLRLALNGARGGHPGAAIDRQAFEFLATEVLDRIDPALRRFLLRVSVLHELDAPRCAAVSGDAQAAHWLQQVERLGLFAAVIDDTPTSQPTLRLHDLFRDALQLRLRQEEPEERLRVLQRAAAIETDPVRRQALWLAAGEPEQAARALLAIGTEVATELATLGNTMGGIGTLVQLCEQFPAEFADSSAELQRVAGMAKWVVWDTHAAQRHQQRAEALFAQRGDTGAALLARAHRCITLIALGRLTEAGALLATLAEDRHSDADADADADAHADADADAHADAAERRIVVALARTWHALEGCHFHHVAPLFEALVQALEQQPALVRWFFTGPPPRQTPCRDIGPALARWASGALAVCGDRPVPFRSMGLRTQAWLALWEGRIADATQLLQRAEADAEWLGQQVIARNHSLALRALLDMAAGHHAEAVQAMHTRLAEHPPTYGDWGLWHTLFLAGRVAAACNDAAALQGWLQRLLSLQPQLPDAEPARLRPVQALLATQAWLQGQHDLAIAGWRAALQDEEHIDLLGQAAEVRVRLAWALARQGALADAAAVLLPLLQRVTASPAARGADAGSGGALFALDAVRALAARHWGGLLGDAQVAELARWAAAAAPPSAAAVPAADELLSTRELEVLEQIAAGASNKLIARALDLSPHTVKRHVANILDKLDLATRSQATAWWVARQRH